MKTRHVRADEVRAGDHLWTDDEERLILKVRDASDGHLVLTLRLPMGQAIELKVAPWVTLTVIDH